MPAFGVNEASAGFMRQAGIEEEEGDQRGSSTQRDPDRPSGSVFVPDREVLDHGETQSEYEKERRDPRAMPLPAVPHRPNAEQGGRAKEDLFDPGFS